MRLDAETHKQLRYLVRQTLQGNHLNTEDNPYITKEAMQHLSELRLAHRCDTGDWRCTLGAIAFMRKGIQPAWKEEA